MANHFLDILVPEYNCAEEDMTNLLNSIIRQKNVNLREIGIIIVNDNSSRQFKKSFFRKFPQLDIEYYIKDKNEGVGMTRQYALDKSSAEYITFVDQDDELYGNESLYKVINILKSAKKDVLYSKYIEELLCEDGSIFNHVHDLKDATEALHGVFVKRNKIIEIGLKFIPEVRYNDDFYYRRILFTLLSPYGHDEITYLWKYNKKSVVRKERKFDYSVEEYYDMFKALEYKIYFLKSKKAYVDENNFCSILGCFMTLESNLFEHEELNELKKKYEKDLYTLICDNPELILKTKFDSLYADQFKACSSKHRDFKVNENFFDFLDRMNKEYPDLKFEFKECEKVLDIILPYYYNNNDRIIKTVDSILYQIACKRDEFNVLIVDDNSKVLLPDSFFSKYSKLSVKYLKKQSHDGFIKSAIYGIQNSSAKYVLILDENCDLFDNFVISNLIKFLKQSNNDVIYTNSIKLASNNLYYNNLNEMGLFGNIYKREYICNLAQKIILKNDYYNELYFDNIIKNISKDCIEYKNVVFRLNYDNTIDNNLNNIDDFFNVLFDSTLFLYNSKVNNYSLLLNNVFYIFLVIESDLFYDTDITIYESKILGFFNNTLKDYYYNNYDECLNLFKTNIAIVRKKYKLKEVRKSFDEFIKENE